MRSLAVHFVALWLALLSAIAPAYAGSSDDLLLFGRPGWVLPGASVDLNFATNAYWTRGATGPLTNTRASAATCFDSAGNLVQVAAYQSCVTNLGVGSWESRTNSIRNSTMQGASVGTPGVAPTNWSSVGTLNGVTTSVTALPTVNGASCVTLSVVGTPTATFGLDIAFDTTTGIPAAYGQTVTESLLISASNTTNFGASTGIVITKVNSGGAGIGSFNYFWPYPTTSLTRYTFSATINDPATAYVWPQFQYNMQSGLAVNYSTTICVPQLELNPNLPATVASAVMAASGTGGVNGAAVYTVSGGTCTTQPTLNVTWTAGVLAVNSVAGAGSCSVLPPSPASLAYASGTATGWTGATVTLTPTDNSAQGFATPPILTSGSAATRLADNIVQPVAQCSAPRALWALGTPQAPAANGSYQTLAEINDGTGLNRYNVSRVPAGYVQGSSIVGGSGTSQGPPGQFAPNTPLKMSEYITAAQLSVVTNNGTVYTGASTGLATGQRYLSIGTTYNGAQLNGTVARVAVSCGQSLLKN